MNIFWIKKLLLVLCVFAMITGVKSEPVKLASCHIRVSNEILMLTTATQNASRCTTNYTDKHSRGNKNRQSTSSLAVVVVEVLAQAQKQTLTTSVTRYHIDLQDCTTSSSAKNIPGNATACTTTLFFPWKNYYNYNTSNSSLVHTLQLHLLLVLQREASLSSAIVLDAIHYLEPGHHGLLLPAQLSASQIPNGGNCGLFLTTQSHDIITQHGNAETSFGAHKTTVTNAAILLVLVLFPLFPLLVLFIAYKPSNICYAQLFLHTACHCFYPLSHHDTYYFHFDCYTSYTSQHATNKDQASAPSIAQDRKSNRHGTDGNVRHSKNKQPQSEHYSNKVDSKRCLPTLPANHVETASPSFITFPPIVLRQPIYDAPIENNTMKIYTNSSKKRGETPSKIAVSSLPTNLRKRKKHTIFTRPDGTEDIKSSTTHKTKERSKINTNKNHNLGRKRLKLFNSSHEREKLWTLEDDSSCKNSFAFI